MINNIIFDIGNVLAKFRWREFIDDLGFAEDIKQRVAEATVLSEYWGEVDRGVMTMQEIIEACVGLDIEIENEIRTFYKDRSALVIEFNYAGWLVRTLKKAGYNIYILSNYGEENFNYVRNVFTFMKYIDGSVISYEVKTIKPEPLIYKTLIDKYNLVPGECVFLDDLKENLIGAGIFGINTIHFTGLTAGIKGLKKLGINMGFDSIIFDLDGTLWDSTDAAAEVWTKEAAEQGVNQAITGNQLKNLYGLPLEEIALKLFPDIDKEKALSIMEKSVISQCPVLAKKGGILFDSVETVLEKLSGKYLLYIVSNCKDGYIEAFFKHYNFGKYFIDYECPGRTGKLKADNIKLVIERNQIVNPVYIGDTKGDKKAAMEADIPFIYAAYGFGKIEENDLSVESFGELLEIL